MTSGSTSFGKNGGTIPGFLDEIRNDEQLITELYCDFADTFDLFHLQAYFIEHFDELLEPPRKALLRSKALVSIDPTASFVFGVTAIDLTIRGCVPTGPEKRL
jgi:hypothetical protein